MKKILLSLGTIALVGVAVVGGTGAFFNDTETSSNNIFVAGAVDLKVDHTKQTYNGVDCKTCSVQVYSSPSKTNVIAASVGASEQGPFPIPAKDVANPHSAWQNEAALVPGQWIWATDPTTVPDTTNGAEYTFENKFQWNGLPVSVDLNLALAADNGYKIVLNGTTIVDKLPTEFNYGSAVSLTAGEETTFKNAMVSGVNTLHIIVRNKPLAANPVTGNPAGLLFKLKIQRDEAECAADSEFQQMCMLWQKTDLTDQVFWNFGDVKPGDTGTNVISLHVYDNDAYACLFTHDIVNKDVSLAEPELDLLDTLDIGELGQFIEVFGWHDTNNNGIFENTEKVLIDSGTPFNQVPAEMIELSLVGNGPVDYVGLSWCFGNQTGPTVGDEDQPLACTGVVPGINIAQTDSLSASLTAYAVQQRNNENFSCLNAFNELFPEELE